MAKFMFVVPPFFGHISPTLSVGASLIASGHQVIWVGIQPLADEHIPRGGRFLVPEQELAQHQEAIHQILKRQDDGPKLSGAETIRLALEETYLPFARFMMKGVCRIASEFEPDVIVSDCITFAGALCAYIKGIPCITTTPVPPDVMSDAMKMSRIFEWQRTLIMDLQRESGIYTDDVVIHSWKLNIVFTSKEFAGYQEPPPHMQFVGPVAGRPNNVAFDWNRLASTTRPAVFVSLGTLLVDIRKDFFQKLIDAFAGEPLTMVVATDPALFDTWPVNFIVQGFVPQLKVMERMDAVICHGGFNTVNDALLNGLPMLITPIAYDHFHTAALIEQAGCGIKIRYKRLRITDFKNAVWDLLQKETYRTAAQRIRETFIQAGGNAKAVTLLEQFAAENRVLQQAG